MMEATISQAPLNEVQHFVLHTFAIAKSDQEKEEITSLYLDYIQKKMDAETDRLWAENKISNEKIGEILQAHCRTPYGQ
jgi:hypothetical protein